PRSVLLRITTHLHPLCVLLFLSCALLFFFFQAAAAHRDLHSFPTRRSSDLIKGLRARGKAARGHHTQDRARLQLHLLQHGGWRGDRKSTRLNSSHVSISYAVFCLKKKKKTKIKT